MPPGSILISIQDSGIRLESSVRDELFMPFEEGRRSEFGRSGLGLGRYICKLTVEAHGGSIAAQASASGGAIFIVSLPLA